MKSVTIMAVESSGMNVLPAHISCFPKIHTKVTGSGPCFQTHFTRQHTTLALKM